MNKGNNYVHVSNIYLLAAPNSQISYWSWSVDAHRVPVSCQNCRVRYIALACLAVQFLEMSSNVFYMSCSKYKTELCVFSVNHSGWQFETVGLESMQKLYRNYIEST